MDLFSGTDLPQNNTKQEIGRTHLSLLEKINKVIQTINLIYTSLTTGALTVKGIGSIVKLYVNRTTDDGTTASLQVNGESSFEKAIKVSGPRVITPTSNMVTLSSESTTDQLQSWNSRPLSLNPNGNNVLIGMTNPGISDTNGGASTSAYWTEKIRGTGTAFSSLGSISTVGLMGFGVTNSSSNDISIAEVQGVTTSSSAGSETGDLAFLTKPSASGVQERMRVTSVGNVYVNTTSGSQLLVVNGNAGNTTGVWVNISDSRIKQNIRPISNALDKVLLLAECMRHYEFKEGVGESGKRTGYIAQLLEAAGFNGHVEESDPLDEAMGSLLGWEYGDSEPDEEGKTSRIVTKEGDKLKMVENNFTPYLFPAIKELTTYTKSLEDRIAKLEAIISKSEGVNA